MATCGFGHLRDIRMNSLCLGGKVIIDSKRNVFANTLNAKTIVSNSQCPTTLLTNKIDEKVTNHGVIINKSMIKNRPGIGRIQLDNSNANFEGDLYKLEPGQSIVFNQSGDFTKTFETTGFGPEYILQPDIETGNINAYTVPYPSDYLNSCLTDFSNVYVECNANFQGMNSFYIPSDDVVKIHLQLLKNDDLVAQAINIYSIKNVGDTRNEFNLQIHDIVKCVPGDNLNIKLINNSTTQEIGVMLTSDVTNLTPLSYVTFKTLAFE
jgi:hypothetical protein